MKSRSSALMALAVMVVVAAGVLLASPAAWAALLPAADWQMNETPGSGTMIDSSGSNNHGTPTDVVQTESHYVFNGSTSRVAVSDSNSLNPGNKDITLTASVQVTNAAMDDDSYDIVRKGLTTTPGGDYKMEIKRKADPTVGKLQCVFKGDVAAVQATARRDIVDGKWYTLECIKTSNSVVAKVTRLSDGRVWSTTKTRSAGSILNSSEVLVGAKQTNPLDDTFFGSMDFVSIYIAQ